MPSPMGPPISELKGYVDACIDAYDGQDGVPWSMMEAIQKKVDAIALIITEGHA
jgi:hypothetical protein